MEPLAPEAVTETEIVTEKRRLKLGRTASTALLLAFFFAVGLAGGVLYRLLPATNSEKPSAAAPVIAQSTVPSSASPLPPAMPDLSPAKPAPPATASSAPVKTAAAPPVPSTTTNAALPAVPPATIPPVVAPVAGKLTPEAAEFAPATDQAANPPSPAPSASATPDKGKAPATAAAKPKLALAKPKKAAPVKHPAVAAAASPSGSAEGPVRVQFGAFAIEDNAHRVEWTVEATGMAVEVAHLPNAKGHLLYYVRSQPFPNRAAALSAAAATQEKAKTLVNPVAIEYIILPEVATPAQQAQVAGH